MPILDAADRSDFLRRQVLTSRNVRGGWLTDFALGGLNYQIEHHLFPSMPRPSLRRSQAMIEAFWRLPFLYGQMARRPVPGELIRRWTEPVLSDPDVPRDLLAYCRGRLDKAALIA